MEQHIGDELRIAQFHGQFARFQQLRQRLPVGPKGAVGGSHPHPQIDRLGESFRISGQRGDRLASAFEELDRGGIGRAFLGPTRRLQQIVRGRFPRLGTKRVFGQFLDVVVQRSATESVHGKQCCPISGGSGLVSGMAFLTQCSRNVTIVTQPDGGFARKVL